MTTKEVKKLGVYLSNVELTDFARDIYGRDEVDYYIREKHQCMRAKPLVWMCGLDEEHKKRLVSAVMKQEV